VMAHTSHYRNNKFEKIYYDSNYLNHVTIHV
jgi:hypothetical protein